MGKLRKNSRFRHALWAIAIGIAVTLIALLASDYRLFKIWELRTYDLRMSLVQKSRPKPQNVVMFFVDEASLRHMETQGVNWPWPRELYASAIDFCKRGGAKAIVFDLFFSEDSVYGADDDATFASGVEGNPVYFVLFLSKNPGQIDSRYLEILENSRAPLSRPWPAWLPSGQSLMSLPIAPLVDAAKGFGNAQMPPDEDGIYRRVDLIGKFGDRLVPSITVKVASDIKNVKAIEWKRKTAMNFGGVRVPLDDEGRMMVNYYGGADTVPGFPLAQILVADAAIAAGQKPEIDPSVVKDKVVVIGVAAPGLYDLKPMPLSRVYPGPEIHATVIENLLTGDFIRPVRPVATAAIALFCGLAAALGLAWMASSWGVGLLLGSLTAALTGAGFGLFWRGVWMPLIPPLGALWGSSFIMIVKNYLTEGRKKRAIKQAFGQYLSPHIVGEIAKDPDKLSLGGIEQEVTLFFSDIADFTSISEKTPPAELVSQLNEYFSMTTRTIQERGGTLDKYIGDAIMAFWGAPLATEDHAAQGTLAALEIQKCLAESSHFITRIGIHTGTAVVGNIGSDIRFNYTAIGDTVNLASRLEGMNKNFGTRIIISEPAYLKAALSIEARRIGRVRVKGRAEPIGIYEPLGPKGDFGKFDAEFCSRFESTLKLFEAAKFNYARDFFRNLAEERGDETAKKYLEVCDKYVREPPKEFHGVITFTTK